MVTLRGRIRSYLETRLAAALLDAAAAVSGTAACLYRRGLVRGRPTLALLTVAWGLRRVSLNIIRGRLRDRIWRGRRHD